MKMAAGGIKLFEQIVYRILFLCYMEGMVKITIHFKE
jgi:hypothetical protein